MKNNIKLKTSFYIVAFALSFLNTTLNAQNFSADNIQEKFIKYQAKNYNEKIFVHTDKTFYITGESIWYKVYCVDEQLHKPSLISKVAYVEIINNENKAVLQAKIAMNDGSGKGSFIIPSFITSGNYTLRVYTKWMENFEADYFYHQTITIFNNLKPGIIKQAEKKNDYSVSFFPEGGNLTEGITSKVAFKSVDAYGEPAECNGTITDENNNHIADFSSFKFGMGSFSFTPEAGKVYKAKVKVADTSFEVKLPATYKQGYVMHLEDENDASLKITVRSNFAYNEMVYLLVHSQNVIKDFQKIKLSKNETSFTIDKNKLADGISDITLFNSDEQPVCERLYFKQPNHKLAINMQPDKNNYQAKNQVSISLDVKDNLPAMADMSVSVFMVDSLQPAAYADINSYLMLASEVKGKITQPEYYFQNNKDAMEAADNLVLTQGWRRFKWENVLQNKNPYKTFLPEAEGLIINGTIKNKFSNQPAGNINATLTVPGENFQFSTATSNVSGNVNFYVKNFYGSNNVVIQTDSVHTFEITQPFAAKFSGYTAPDLKISELPKQQLLFRSINAQADDAYLIDKKQRSYVYSLNDTALFYGKPDKRYNLDDYTRFLTMEEVLREYVAEVRARKTGEQYNFRVIDIPAKSFAEDNPLILLNGVPVANPNLIMETDPLKIKRLDVVGRKYYYGNTVSTGIVSFTTYTSNINEVAADTKNVIVKFDGLQREREFYSPVYNSNENAIPDLRNVLFWSPAIKTDVNGKAKFSFYTSELSGKFTCIIQGISKEGIAGSSMISFDVTK